MNESAPQSLHDEVRKLAEQVNRLSRTVEGQIANGVPVGMIADFPCITGIPSGWISIASPQILQRDVFPDLFQFAERSGTLINDDVWQNRITEFGECASFSKGDGVSTFRPPVQRAYRKGFNIQYNEQPGNNIHDNLPKSVFNGWVAGKQSQTDTGVMQRGDHLGITPQYAEANASDEVVYYDTMTWSKNNTSPEMVVRSGIYLPCMKAFDRVCKSAVTDIDYLATNLTTKADLNLFKSDLRESGFITLPSGFKLIWGQATISVSDYMITFPTNCFLHKCLNFNAMPIYSEDLNILIQMKNLTREGAVVAAYSDESRVSTACYWTAFGY